MKVMICALYFVYVVYTSYVYVMYTNNVYVVKCNSKVGNCCVVKVFPKSIKYFFFPVVLMTNDHILALTNDIIDILGKIVKMRGLYYQVWRVEWDVVVGEGSCLYVL